MTNILVVDDDKINGKVTKARLQDKGYNIELVNSGKACLEYIENNHIDIILLDVVMPDMNGIETLKEIRKSVSETQMSIIMLTALTETVDMVLAFHEGANDYLTKPINVDLAMARINTQEKLLRLSQQQCTQAELEVLHDLVVTYNCEINNPLTVAYANMPDDFSEMTPEKLAKAKQCMKKISEIMKKIAEIQEEGNLERQKYTNDAQVLKLG